MSWGAIILAGISALAIGLVLVAAGALWRWLRKRFGPQASDE